MLDINKPNGRKEHTEVAQAMCGPLPQASPHIPHGEPEVALTHQLQLHEETLFLRFPKLDTPLLHLPSFPDFSGFWWEQLKKTVASTSPVISLGTKGGWGPIQTKPRHSLPGSPWISKRAQCLPTDGSIMPSAPVLASLGLADTPKSSWDMSPSHNSPFPTKPDGSPVAQVPNLKETVG